MNRWTRCSSLVVCTCAGRSYECALNRHLFVYMQINADDCKAKMLIICCNHKVMSELASVFIQANQRLHKASHLEAVQNKLITSISIFRCCTAKNIQNKKTNESNEDKKISRFAQIELREPDVGFNLINEFDFLSHILGRCGSLHVSRTIAFSNRIACHYSLYCPAYMSLCQSVCIHAISFNFFCGVQI